MLHQDRIIQGNTLDVLKTMPNESIDCVITSPPYWGLRDYGIGGQIGLEPTFQLYIEHLQQIFDEVYRVLKKSGTCWVNIGDTYNSHNRNNEPNWKSCGLPELINRNPIQDVQTKSLCNIPHRFAISMTDSSPSWILRNTIIWHKPSCMPSSAKDRFTVDFEYVFFFTKNRRYYFEQLFEDMSANSIERYKTPIKCGTPYEVHPNEKRRNILYMTTNQKNGRNKRAVWRINPQPFKDAHFAVFPEKLVEPMIQAGCPREICDSCGVAYETNYNHKYPQPEGYKEKYKGVNFQSPYKGPGHGKNTRETNKQLKKCDCNAPTHAGIVLDPFVGSGTTCLVARKLGRHYIGIDLQPDYCKMAEKRLAEVL